jgi:hypothetical protein
MKARYLLVALLWAAPAAAQTLGGVQLTPTTFTRVSESLSDLLNAGWKVIGVGGAGGEIVLLQNSTKIIRCDLQSLNEIGRRLSLVTEGGSICNHLN